MRVPNLRAEAKLAIISQTVIVISLFPLVWIFSSLQAAGSFVLGGIIAILPNIYLLQKFFSGYEGCPRRIMSRFFRGQTVKWILVATGFVLATQISWILPLLLFLGFIVAQLGFILLPLRLAQKKRNRIKNN